MCLSIPARVLAIDGDACQAEYAGNTITVGLHLVADVAVGDYVLVHAGFALEKLRPADAAETLRLMDELLQHVQAAETPQVLAVEPVR